MVLNGHHGDGRFALWCAAEDGVQQMLVEADPSGSSARRTWATAAGSACASTGSSTGRSSRGSSRTPTSRSRLRGWSRRRDAAPRRSRPSEPAAARPRPERRPPEDAPGDADGEQREDRGDREAPVVAAGQRGQQVLAVRRQRVASLVRDRRDQRDTDRTPSCCEVLSMPEATPATRSSMRRARRGTWG